MTHSAASSLSVLHGQMLSNTGTGHCHLCLAPQLLYFRTYEALHGLVEKILKLKLRRFETQYWPFLGRKLTKG